VLSASTGGSSTYYERDASGALIAERGAGGEFYYVTDGNGSTVALVDTTGTVQATYSYDPAGQTTNIGGPNPAIASGNPYRYAGGYTDTTTGLIKFGARYYNPTLGRWTQLDALTSLLDFTNGNRYAYAGDDPINNADPNGHFAFLPDESDFVRWALNFVADDVRYGSDVLGFLDGPATDALSASPGAIADAIENVASNPYVTAGVIREQLFTGLASFGSQTALVLSDAIDAAVALLLP